MRIVAFEVNGRAFSCASSWRFISLPLLVVFVFLFSPIFASSLVDPYINSNFDEAVKQAFRSLNEISEASYENCEDMFKKRQIVVKRDPEVSVDGARNALVLMEALHRTLDGSLSMPENINIFLKPYRREVADASEPSYFSMPYHSVALPTLDIESDISAMGTILHEYGHAIFAPSVYPRVKWTDDALSKFLIKLSLAQRRYEARTNQVVSHKEILDPRSDFRKSDEAKDLLESDFEFIDREEYHLLEYANELFADLLVVVSMGEPGLVAKSIEKIVPEAWSNELKQDVVGNRQFNRAPTDSQDLLHSWFSTFRKHIWDRYLSSPDFSDGIRVLKSYIEATIQLFDFYKNKPHLINQTQSNEKFIELFDREMNKSQNSPAEANSFGSTP